MEGIGSNVQVSQHEAFVGLDHVGRFQIKGPGDQSLPPSLMIDQTARVSINNGLSVFGTDLQVCNASLSIQRGNLTLSEGSVSVKKGGVHLSEGSVSLMKGGLTLQDGNVHVEKGGLTLKDGNVAILNGHLTLNGKQLDLSTLPSFSVYLNQTLIGQTGAGRNVKIIPQTVDENEGGGYNPLSGDFVAPSNGTYNLNCQVSIDQSPSEIFHVAIWILKNNSSQKPNYYSKGNLVGGQFFSFNVSWLTKMAVGDQAACFFRVSGLTSGNTIRVFGLPNNYATSFEGSKHH